ncbi:MAG: TRAP transporter small permease subunit [Bacteroidota bacterium]
MKGIEKVLVYVLRLGTLVSTCALIASVLLQIFSRFFLAQAPAWTEEASRLFFVYATAFAAGLAYKDGDFIAFEGVYTRLSQRTQRFFDSFIPVLVSVLFGLFTYFSFPFIIQGYGETSPSIGMRMSVAFFSMVILAIGICFFALLPLIHNLYASKS